MSFKILSIDDESDMEMLITQQFRRQIRNKDFEFIFANNGAEALEKLDEIKDIGLILSDINMPEMDGLTFLSKLNEMNNPYLKAIMVSAYNDMDNIRTAMNRGAFDFVTKPINFSDLEITINKTIAHIEMMMRSQREHDQLIAIQNDLNIAQDIQQAMLPKTNPPFPDRTDFDLHAFLKAAKMVGGDLYDYFLMDENRLFFIIGDVSDKGVPASLFMAITKTIFKSHFSNKNCGAIHEEVYRINSFLSADNQSMMFVTAFIGILDLTTGIVEYIDAGHEPPLILRQDKTVEVLKKKGGLALCIDGEYEYVSATFTLQPGDTLFTYTDGVPDANNLAGERFGMERIKKILLEETFAAKPQHVNETMLQHLQEFIGENAQFDDITALTLHYAG
ncbi:SpoIIE family protein phosphatase [Spirosoma endophyticum]|uniref:Sigma-B regulation protein RsbU (Phosphoserine phosphatase) n=1 Tax=Spirosoma endophyticum TaxID=662367 RepID=A0A1I1IN84_9BACT|nr:SpoIIE family protein phosphatase [Spirosoma endophyticum]SFC37172.1 sigma-B regulation protein RsbU (phosphoserine phosphatase) [Spirosoma endophyticum]